MQKLVEAGRFSYRVPDKKQGRVVFFVLVGWLALGFFLKDLVKDDHAGFLKMIVTVSYFVALFGGFIIFISFRFFSALWVKVRKSRGGEGQIRIGPEGFFFPLMK